MAQTAIKINLYDGSDKVFKTFQRSRIPWGVLKRAIRMASGLDEENIQEEDLDQIAMLVSDAFGGEVSVDELDKYGDIAEMIGAPVHLFLFVKVRERWADDPERYRGMGLEFPRD